MEGGALVEGREYKDLKNVGDAILALHSFMELQSYLHPMCYGAKALFRLILEKYTEGQISTIQPIIRMFMSVQSENANKACAERAPLTFEELIPKWEGIKDAKTNGHVCPQVYICLSKIMTKA